MFYLHKWQNTQIFKKRNREMDFFYSASLRLRARNSFIRILFFLRVFASWRSTLSPFFDFFYYKGKVPVCKSIHFEAVPQDRLYRVHPTLRGGFHYLRDSAEAYSLPVKIVEPGIALVESVKIV